MASAPGSDGTIDVRSAAITSDVEFNKNACAPGAAAASIRGPFYRGATKIVSVVTTGRKRPSDPYFTAESDELNPPDLMDSVHSWIGCLCSSMVVFIVCGLVYSYGIWGKEFWTLYGTNFGKQFEDQMEMILLIGAISMSLMILFNPVAALLIRPLGYRLTAILGLLLMFLGIFFEGLAQHLMTYIICRALLLPIGASCAYTAAHHISNVFAKQLLVAMSLLSCASVLGVLFFFWFTSYLINNPVLGYKWVLLIYSILLLVTIAITYAFPRKFLAKKSSRDANHRISACIKSKAKEAALRKAEKINPDSNDDLKSCLCVCVCNVATCDCGFLLWAIITMTATLTFHIPYLFLFMFVNSSLVQTYYTGITPSSLMGLLLLFCIGNLIGRLYLLLDIDFTFIHNRTIFQVMLFGSGLLYFFFKRASTWGWFAVWFTVVGITQGFLTASIPRVTLQTVPTPWLKMAWVFIVIADGFATFLGPLLLIILGGVMDGADLPFFSIGLAQIIGSILTFLIPNEEANYEPEGSEGQGKYAYVTGKDKANNKIEIKTTPKPPPPPYPHPALPFREKGSFLGSKNLCDPTPYASVIIPKLSIHRSPFRRPCYTGEYRSTFSIPGITTPRMQTYTCNCPICAKIGPMSECSPCKALLQSKYDTSCSCNPGICTCTPLQPISRGPSPCRPCQPAPVPTCGRSPVPKLRVACPYKPPRPPTPAARSCSCGQPAPSSCKPKPKC